MRELILSPELCDECLKCERICPRNSIRLINGVPIFCMHCAPEKAPCLNICPEGAIIEKDGAIIIDEKKCVGCGLCRDACPIGAIYTDEHGIPHKCDLCIEYEKPLCIAACPTGALIESSENLLSTKRDKLATELRKIKDLIQL
ncbi:MAG TPA: 4Fe-4S dicluster domain-containing protein [Methanothermobacter sp.]|nr:formate hydrogenlyase iron-sulfur subunit [Methanothermobacter sp. MT-2]HHW04480.1 4Fe-4S dicluster domain-containing protein [Methanothermobacter sp.]HOK73042.1 4Fe-4S dicluster domain-containing protein [Methanothermobacter sp.]HOL69348.1 4Fe-4S dicluster domain-containing protein [Methanothermobacter sp.]HPQ04566.1 4Fe-4S dicluster domain-containing protein [Methanothermobacter sp.]